MQFDKTMIVGLLGLPRFGDEHRAGEGFLAWGAVGLRKGNRFCNLGWIVLYLNYCFVVMGIF